ncbi:ferrochelatase [Pseudokineococcus sp. 1T1Z-3]|uniref:ferrochelatase n=1 Tax=Pseudokineococcus sp. 1T1Z-3 TaxID=3132745 RepID=UPI00403F6325
MPGASSGASLEPYDAVLLLSFGGPEQPDDVMPFLRNVTAGRGIPDERLADVAEHYHHFGGRSPINDQNRALLAALRREVAGRGLDVPVAWGNRNWAPYVTDALRDLHTGGARRVLVVATSAYASYSGCRQYREDLGGALLTLAQEGRDLAVDKVRHYFDAPGFVAANADALEAAWRRLPQDVAERAEVVFVTHSIPTAMAESAGPAGGAYERQHQAVADAVLARVRTRTGATLPAALVYCSRSGPPSQPWTEPDVNDHLEELSARGVPAVVVAPIGFVSDHMEVVYDLDTEAAETAGRLGLSMERAGTAGVAPAFVAALVDLVVERAAVERAAAGRQEPPERPSEGAEGPSHDVCPVGCCPNLRAGKPAACGRDWPGPRAVLAGAAAGSDA